MEKWDPTPIVTYNHKHIIGTKNYQVKLCKLMEHIGFWRSFNKFS
jgi:hypothetical protein